MGEFQGKVVMITGGGSGIGRATARLFGREGARVAVIDRNELSGRETASLVEQQGGEAIAILADVSKNGEIRDAVTTIVARCGRIDVLFACAATQITKPVADTDEEDWDRIYAVNLKGTFLCCKHVIPVMRQQGGGSIVIASSGHAFVTYPNSSAYAGTKGGLLAFMRGVALDYAEHGIRANCVVPGATDTPMLRGYINSCPDPGAEEARIISSIPMRRLARPEDVAKAVRFLASSDASYITGTWLAVDGGLLAQG